jgi:hypothetical protein
VLADAAFSPGPGVATVQCRLLSSRPGADIAFQVAQKLDGGSLAILGTISPIASLAMWLAGTNQRSAENPDNVAHNQTRDPLHDSRSRGSRLFGACKTGISS